MRRLKVVDLSTLLRRSIERQKNPIIDLSGTSPELQITPNEQINFFKCIRLSLVLSSHGEKNEASKMSGGDYGTFVLFCLHITIMFAKKTNFCSSWYRWR
jgi:hypothetical protein